MIRFTYKQLEILDVIKTGNPDRTHCTVYDILDRITYECKRDAMLHSIAILVKEGYIERKELVKMDGRAKRVFCVTTKALDVV